MNHVSKRILIAVAAGCGLAVVSLLYGRTGVDVESHGAPFPFLQIGMTLSFENYYRVDFSVLLLDILAFYMPVWLILYLFRSRNPLRHADRTPSRNKPQDKPPPNLEAHPD